MNHPLDRTQELPTETLRRGTSPRQGESRVAEPADGAARAGHAPLGAARPEKMGVGAFLPGKAAVPQKQEPTLTMKPELPTGQIVTSGQLKRPKLPLRERLRVLRSGGRWSMFGVAVLVVCWLLWALQSGGDNLGGSALILALILMVAVGLFGVSRLAGSIILEKLLSRTRRSALLSHMAIGLFLTIAGLSLLPQVAWVINAWNQVRGMR